MPSKPKLTATAILKGAEAGHAAALAHLPRHIPLNVLPQENQDQALKVAEATIRAALAEMFGADPDAE